MSGGGSAGARGAGGGSDQLRLEKLWWRMGVPGAEL